MNLRLDNGTSWPDPEDQEEIEWQLRYGTATREQLLGAAAYIQAYRALVQTPNGIERLARLRRAYQHRPEDSKP